MRNIPWGGLGSFDVADLKITTGDKVAFAHGLLSIADCYRYFLEVN